MRFDHLLFRLLKLAGARQTRGGGFPRGTGWRLGLGVVLGWMPMAAWSAAPMNDVCTGAELIPAWAGAQRPYLTAVTDLREASNAGDPVNSCQEAVDRGVWFQFTPTNTAFFTLSTDPQVAPGTTVEDTVLAIYTSVGGCNGPFVQVPDSADTHGCNDDMAEGILYHSQITTLLLADATYYILVWRYDDLEPLPPLKSQIQLQVVRPNAPGNDTCESAAPLYLNSPVQGTTIGATNDYELGETACFTGIGNLTPTTAGLRDVVYAFTAPSAGLYSFRLINLSVVNDFVLCLVPQCPPPGNPAVITDCLAAVNRNIGGAEELNCVPLGAQQQVFLVVDENLFEADPYWQGGNFRLEATLCTAEVEPNDYPTNATPFECAIEGAIDPRRDVDFYALGTFPQGSRLFALVDGGAASGVRDFDLRLTTATRTLEFDDADNGLEFGNFSPNISGAPLPREPVFLRVDYRDTRFAAEPYRVYAVVQPSWIKAQPETEPNDTRAQGNLSARNYWRGSLGGPAPSTDVDVFTFPAESGELLFVSLDGNPHRNDATLDARLRLLDNEGNALISINDPSSEEANSSTNTSPGSLSANTPFSPGEAFVYRIIDDGIYHVQVTVSSTAATNVAAGDYLLSIARGCASTIEPNQPLQLGAVTAPSLVNEGQAVTIAGSFSDPDPLDTHTLIIDWGDVIETNELAPGVLNFQRVRPYPDNPALGSPLGSYLVTVQVIDEAGAAVGTNFTIAVANVRPVIKSLELGATTVLENEVATVEGTFTDPGLGDVHRLEIAWGDGVTNIFDLPVGERNFSLSHRYLDDAPTGTPADSYTITVRITDDDGGTDDDATSITVQNVAPIVTGVTVSSPIWPQTTAIVSGTMLDPGTLDTLAVTVDWGDGSTPQTTLYAPGSRAFSATHAYTLVDTTLPIQVTVQDDDGGSGTGVANVTIRPAPVPLEIVAIDQITTNRVRLNLKGSPNATYRLLISTNLVNWAPLNGGQYTADGSGVIVVEDTVPSGGPRRFYRGLWP